MRILRVRSSIAFGRVNFWVGRMGRSRLLDLTCLGRYLLIEIFDMYDIL